MEQYLWVERFRPRRVDDVILPDSIKGIFKGFVKNDNVNNITLNGPAGIGKTTIAVATLEEMGCDYIKINASLNRNIDTLRNEITNFATTSSFAGGRKYVILDEADRLGSLFQDSLRGFIEEYSRNCGFILTCNHKNQIIEPLHSRCPIIDFIITDDEKPEMMKQFYMKTIQILKENNIEYDKSVVAELINAKFPDFRMILGMLQAYSVKNDVIDSGLLDNIGDVSFETVIEILKKKSFKTFRTWVGENTQIDYNQFIIDFCNYVIDNNKVVTPALKSSLILITRDSLRDLALSIDPQIVLSAFLLTVMAEIEFT